MELLYILLLAQFAIMVILACTTKTLRKIMAKQDELAISLNSVADQLGKALGELVDALAKGGQTTPEVDAAVVRLQAAASALDDLNPDL